MSGSGESGPEVGLFHEGRWTTPAYARVSQGVDRVQMDARGNMIVNCGLGVSDISRMGKHHP